MPTKRIGFSLFMLMMLPSFIFVFGNVSSMVYGTILSILVFIILTPPRRLILKVKEYLILPIILIIPSQILYLLNGSHNEKGLYSLFILFFFIVSGYLIANQILFYENVKYRKLVTNIFYLMFFLGVFQVFFKVSSLGYQDFAKSIFPFAEPSHYAINLAPFLIFSTYYSNKFRLIQIIILILFMGVSYPSTILMSLAMIITFLKLKSKIVLHLVVACLLVIYFGGSNIDTNYFLDRLIMHKNNNNVTSLVYLQGWEDAYNGFLSNHGFGLGFQNMGKGELGYYGQRIESTLGQSKNRNDGGFLAAKILGEFGVLGLLFLIYYIKQLFKSTKILMRVKRATNGVPNEIAILSHSIVVGFFVELFLRGYGYFTPTVFLFMVSVMILKSQKLSNKDLNVIN